MWNQTRHWNKTQLMHRFESACSDGLRFYIVWTKERKKNHEDGLVFCHTLPLSPSVKLACPPCLPWSLRKGLLSCEAVDTENLCQAQISLAYNIPFKGLGTATSTLRRNFGPQENQTKKAWCFLISASSDGETNLFGFSRGSHRIRK
jgi:hypothetical protein